MKIRARLIVAFSILIVLFATNLAIYVWGNRSLNVSVQRRDTAAQRELLMAGISKHVDDLNKQIAARSGVYGQVALFNPEDPSAAGLEGASQEDIAKFQEQLNRVGVQIAELRTLSKGPARARVDAFYDSYQALNRSWSVVYTNLGRDQTAAIIEQASADVLFEEIKNHTLPDLSEEARQNAERERVHYQEVDRFTFVMTILLFCFSLLAALLVAYRVSRHLAMGLDELDRGAAAIGAGNLELRLPAEGKDELADLARSFNEMAGKVLAARSEIEAEKKEAEKQREMAESLLLNILPAQVARELREKGLVDPKYFEDVTILFTDFKGFTLATEKLAAEELVSMLHNYFLAFDEIATRYGVEKIKTIGDSYMLAGGLPDRKPSHPLDVVLAGLEMAHAVSEINRRDLPAKWEVRIGVHTGSVVAGVVGVKKFAFDIWGDTVNYASRMESSGVPGRVNLSEQTHARIKDFIACASRGKVLTKEKKEMEMFFADGILPKLLDESGTNPPPAFAKRYGVYFQKDPPILSKFLLGSLENRDRQTSQGGR